MATIIRIKRSAGQSAPGSLKAGELAYSGGSGLYNNGGDRLYYGKGDDGSGGASSVVVIGGEYFADLLDHQPGTLTASSAIITDASSKIDQILVDNIGIGVSDGNTITSTDTNGNIVLSPNGTGTVDVATSRITSVSSPISGTDAANRAYVDAVATSQTLTFKGDSASASTVDLDSQEFSILGGASIGTRVSGQTVTIELDPTGVTANTYGSATQIPVLTVNDQGQITTATTASLATTLNLDGDVGTGDVALLDSSLEIAGGTNITTTVSNNTITVALDDSSTINGSLTVDNIKLDGNTIYTPGASVLYLDPHPVGDSGDVVILGNLTVQGTTTTVNSTIVSLNDLNLVLADSAANAGEADGAGITIGGDLYSGTKPTITYDAATDRWDFSKDIEVANVTVTGLVDTNTLVTDSASVLGDIRITGSFIDITTDELTEGSTNLYFTDERVDDRLNNLLLAGEGIDLVYVDDSAGGNEGSLTISGEDATLTNKGIASFGGYADSAGAPTPGNSRQFELTSGDVRIAVIDGGVY